VQSEHGLLTTVAYKFGSQATQYALEGSIAVTGSAIQWLRDQLQLIETAPEIESLADQVSDSGGVYFVPAFSGLFAPHWQSDVRGTFLGITRATNKAHIARATLEAICFQTRDILEAMSADTGVPLREMRVDGGITANSLCMQLQADVMGIDVIRPQVLETTALGAAYAAGMGVGIYDDQRSLIENWNEGSRWKPSHESLLFRDGYRNWKQAITAAMAWRA
jgi:glycerol kinase